MPWRAPFFPTKAALRWWSSWLSCTDSNTSRASATSCSSCTLSSLADMAGSPARVRRGERRTRSASLPVHARHSWPPRRGLELGASDFDDTCESCFVAKSDVGEDFTVELDTGFAQTMNQAAVGDTLSTRSGVDTGNPQAAEGALTGFTVAVLVSECFEYRVPGGTVERTAVSTEALGELQNFFTTTTSNKSTTDACHNTTPKRALYGSGLADIAARQCSKVNSLVRGAFRGTGSGS